MLSILRINYELAPHVYSSGIGQPLKQEHSVDQVGLCGG